MNKNFKKSMALALTLIIGIFSLFNQSFADTSYLDSSGLESVDNIFNDEINSNGIFGEDEYVYISENFNNSDIKPRATSFYTRESIVNTQRKNWVFVDMQFQLGRKHLHTNQEKHIVPLLGIIFMVYLQQ